MLIVVLLLPLAFCCLPVHAQASKKAASRPQSKTAPTLAEESAAAVETTETGGQPEENAGEQLSEPSEGSLDPKGAGFLSSYEFWITMAILLFGLVVIAVQYSLLSRQPDFQGTDILRVFSSTIILIGTLVFITAGYGTDQSAPALGLFGTIAGYILGRSSKEGP